MKYKNQEVKNVNHLAKTLILHTIVDLEDKVYKDAFGGLDIRSDIARQVLKDNEGFEVSELETELLIKTIKFEVAKVLGKLENQTGIDTGLVARNNQGFVDKNSYFNYSIDMDLAWVQLYKLKN